jgi:predicted RNase H-like HicB family nuclease
MANETRPIVLDQELGNFGIWLGQPPDIDSICLGAGDTFEEALQDARSELMRAAVSIEQLRPTSPVLSEVVQERARQDAQWGGPATDDTREARDWVQFINHQVGRFVQAYMHTPPTPVREVFVKIAALAIAAVESIDRKAAR